MKISCDYCSNTYEDTLEKCPHCGGPNPTHKTMNGEPKTIEELKAWYTARNLPSEDITRFFIGKDVKEARAFGIYKADNGEFIVYKNKADGSRAIRYQGKDETYAVHEIWLKLKDEIVHQKNRNSGSKNSSENGTGNVLLGKVLLFILSGTIFFSAAIPVITIVGMLGMLVFGKVANVNNGYYKYNDTTYYNYRDNWYSYDTDDHTWVPAYDYSDSNIKEIKEDYDAYQVAENWDSSIGTSDWDDSSYATEFKDSMDWSSDSDYDWDSGGSDWDSWDSGSDWDSDW